MDYKNINLEELITKPEAEVEEYLLFVEVAEFIDHVKKLIELKNNNQETKNT